MSDEQPKVLWRKHNVLGFESYVVNANKNKPSHPWYAPAGIVKNHYERPKVKLVITGAAALKDYLRGTRGYSHMVHAPRGCSEVHFKSEDDALACYLRFS